MKTNAVARHVLSGWTVGGILRYASGKPIRTPQAQNNLSTLLFRGTNSNRVPGQPLFLKDPNCNCIDPNKDFILNPAAWSDPRPASGVRLPHTTATIVTLGGRMSSSASGRCSVSVSA